MTKRHFVDKTAADIRPGHITLDGVVLEVETLDDQNISIRHRSVTYIQEPGSTVQVFGRVSADVVKHILDTMAAAQ